jgi:hypothetical protein
MPIFVARRLLLLGVLALIFGPGVHAQSSAPLDLSLHVSAAQVRREGALRLAVVFRNGDAEQMLALRGNPEFAEGGGLQLTVIDAGGTRRVVAIPATGVRSPNPAGAERVRILPPGHGTSVHRRIQASMLFPAVGHYRLEVSYTPPADPPTALPAGSISASAAVSGQVEVEVTE